MVFVFAAAIVVVVVVVVGGVTVLVVFCGQDFEKCLSCLQFQHWGFWPSTTTVITWFSFSKVWGMAVNPPLSRHMVKM